MKLIIGNALESLKTLESESVQCCVTSPPYWGLRDYGVDGQLGLEKTPEEYIAKLVGVFEEVRRVLRKDGTLWLNIGDSYAGSGKAQGQKPNHTNMGKPQREREYDVMAWTPVPRGLKAKDLCMIPARVAIALQRAGWWLRSEIVWHKPNPMPESVTDRPTKSHEMIYLLTKSARYYYDAGAIKEKSAINEERPDGVVRNREWGYDSKQNKLRGRHIAGKGQKMGTMSGIIPQHDIMPTGFRSKRSVWTVTTEPYRAAHFATFPTEIPRICIAAGTKKGDVVLDPFAGSGTTGEVALRMERDFIGIDLNGKYIKELAEPRLRNVAPLFQEHK